MTSQEDVSKVLIKKLKSKISENGPKVGANQVLGIDPVCRPFCAVVEIEAQQLHNKIADVRNLHWVADPSLAGRYTQLSVRVGQGSQATLCRHAECRTPEHKQEARRAKAKHSSVSPRVADPGLAGRNLRQPKRSL